MITVKFKSLLLTTLCFIFCTTIKAQDNNSNYTGSTVENAEGKTVYLYNIDTHKFLYPGNSNGTTPSLLYNDLGFPLNISKGAMEYHELNDDYEDICDNGSTVYKKISTPIFNANGNTLGIESKENSTGVDNDIIFLNSDEANGNRWLIEKVGEDASSNIYTIRIFDTKDRKYHLLKAMHNDGNTDADKTTNTKVGSVAQDIPYGLDYHFTASDLTEYRTRGFTIYDTYVSGNINASVDKSHLDKTGSYVTNCNSIDEEFSLFDDNDNTFYAPVGKYDFTLTYIPTEGINSFDVELRTQDYDGEQPYYTHTFNDIDASGDGTEVSKAKTVHCCFNVQTEWTTLDITIHGPLDHYDEDNQAVYEPLPNIVSYSITMAPDQPTDDNTLQYARWQIVTKDEILNKLKAENTKQFGGEEGNADATFLMKDQGFTDGDEDKWETDGSATYTKGTFTDGEKVMYTNARISGTGNVYQDVEVPNTGVYQFDAYGFSKGNATNMYYQYATGTDEWSDVQATKPLATLADETLANEESAGTEFYNESVLGNGSTYKSTLMVYVPRNAAKDADGNYKIRIGFNKANDATDDYTAVDDIHLHYKGQSAFVLDGDWNDDKMEAAIAGANEESGSGVPVYIKRKFWQSAWNPVVLPVSVTGDQVKAIFGDNVYVATPYGLVNDNNKTIMRFDLLNDNSKDLVANNYYLIYTSATPQGVTSLPYFQKSTDGKYTLEGQDALNDGNEYFYLGNIDINSNQLQTSIAEMQDGDKNANGASFVSQCKKDGEKVKVVGGYANFEMPDKSYVFTNKNRFLHYLAGKTSTMGAFKFYVGAEDNSTSSAKEGLQMSVYDGTATGIKDISTTDNGNVGPGNGIVYNLSGERVAEEGNTDRLPAGIYIINGRKFIKK